MSSYGRCLMQNMAVNMIAFYLISLHLALWYICAGNYVKRLTALLIILALFMQKILLSASYYCCYLWLELNHSKYNSDLSPFQPLCTILRGNKWAQLKGVSIILIYQDQPSANLLNKRVSLGQQMYKYFSSCHCIELCCSFVSGALPLAKQAEY